MVPGSCMTKEIAELLPNKTETAKLLVSFLFILSYSSLLAQINHPKYFSLALFDNKIYNHYGNSFATLSDEN